MESRTTFRFEAGDVRFELSGSEEFVRKNLAVFVPFVEKAIGPIAGASRSAGPGAAAPAPAGAPSAAPGAGAPASNPHDLAGWWDKSVPSGTRVSMQDTILVLAFWMRGFKKYIFTSEDIRRGFETLGQTEPKSLLQILGTLKRDHNLILGTERRGEYMLNTTGIDRVRQILGIPASPRPAAQMREEPASGAPQRELTDQERAARAVLDL